jgi:hypothetical protein
MSNDGIMKGSMEDSQPVHDGAWVFDGSDDFIDFGNILNLTNKDWLYSNWVYDTNLASKYFISKYQNGSNYWYIGTDASRKIIAKAVQAGVTIWDYVSDVALTNSAWNFISVVKNSSEILMLINTSSVAVTENTAVQSTSVTNTGSLYKMRYNTTYSGGRDGVCPFYIYDGLNGAPGSLPGNYVNLIKNIYNNTRRYYL